MSQEKSYHAHGQNVTEAAIKSETISVIEDI